MGLKALPKNELISVLNNLAYKELATGTKRWDCGVVAEESTSLFRIGLETRISNIKVCYNKIVEYSGLTDKGAGTISAKGYRTAVEILEKIVKDIVLSDLKYQKELYAEENNIYNSHSLVEFPLDKKPELNALYDDFAGVFLYFDNIGTIARNMGTTLGSITSPELFKKVCEIAGIDETEKEALARLHPDVRKEYWCSKHGVDAVDYFESLETEAEKLEYVKANVEFDNCMLGGVRNPNWGISVYGKSEKALNRLGDSSQQVLSAEDNFVDFGNVSLAETLKIKNQDLMQIMQSRIDMDKEHLELLDEKEIGGDSYRLLSIPKDMLKDTDRESVLLIRFVCPSTGRVYHVSLSENNLSNSKYYKKGDYSTYIDAWWQITHGGVDPKTCEYVIRT